MQYKLIALDMDGTVLDSNKKIGARTLSAIHRAVECGVKVIISTGRSYQGVRGYNEILKLETPMISYHGGMVLQPTDETILYQRTLREEDALAIMRLGLEFGVSQVIWSNERLYTFADSPHIREYAENMGISFTIAEAKMAETFAKQGVSKIIWSDEPEQVARYIQELPSLLDGDMAYCTSCSHFLEFTDKHVSKGKALAFLSEYFQIAPEEMIAVGDGMNDKAMLKYAGLGVAMGNASDVVKGFADVVTRTNDEDGVADVIEAYIL